MWVTKETRSCWVRKQRLQFAAGAMWDLLSGGAVKSMKSRIDILNFNLSARCIWCHEFPDLTLLLWPWFFFYLHGLWHSCCSLSTLSIILVSNFCWLVMFVSIDNLKIFWLSTILQNAHTFQYKKHIFGHCSPSTLLWFHILGCGTFWWSIHFNH